MSAGTIMPPSAAVTGRAARRGEANSPYRSSRLILEPDDEEEDGEEALVHRTVYVQGDGKPRDIERELPGQEVVVAVLFQGEFAQTSAATVAASSTMPPNASVLT